MNPNKIELENLSEIAVVQGSDQFVLVDKSITHGNDATDSGKTSKISFFQLSGQLIPPPPANGSAGVKGSKGEPGPRGAVGVKGIPGPKGTTGITGPRGDYGMPGQDGAKGPKGHKGDIGVKGRPGRRGDLGLEGLRGYRGEPGSPGKKGPVGYHGDTGEPGIKGLPGAKGPKGSYGTTQLSGHKGQKGPAGYGQKGLKGNKGERGIRGQKGVKGRKGPVGRDTQNIVVTASDMEGNAWSETNLQNGLSFRDTASTGYNPNSRLLIKVRKGIYFNKWRTANDLYAEVCLQNADFVKGPTLVSGFLESTVDSTLYPVIIMPHEHTDITNPTPSERHKYHLKVCVFDGHRRYDLPYEVYECDEY